MLPLAPDIEYIRTAIKLVQPMLFILFMINRRQSVMQIMTALQLARLASKKLLRNIKHMGPSMGRLLSYMCCRYTDLITAAQCSLEDY